MKLYDKARLLLKKRPHDVTFKDVSVKTQITEHWLKKFNRGEILNPSVNKIETLINYLEGLNVSEHTK